MTNPAEILLDLSDVGFTAGGNAILSGVSGSVRRGDALFITGRSGCGKSTLMKIMAGIQYQSRGKVRILGTDLLAAYNDELLEIHARCGFVFQDSALISNLTIFDNLALSMRYRREFPEAEIRDRVNAALERAGLVDDGRNRPAALSMGERKMAAIMRSFLGEPEILFLDEPLASLDLNRVDLARELIREQMKKGVTVVAIAHESDFVRDFAKTMWVIKTGRLARQVATEEIPETVAHLAQEIA